MSSIVRAAESGECLRIAAQVAATSRVDHSSSLPPFSALDPSLIAGTSAKPSRAKRSTNVALKFIICKVVKFAGTANFGALDALAAQHAEFFYR